MKDEYGRPEDTNEWALGDRPSSAHAEDLTRAVAEAVRAGEEELGRLDQLVLEVESRVSDAWPAFARGSRRVDDGDGFATLLAGMASDLRETMDDSRRTLSTFNIVFLGRTGAGKSTLLSALGGLDGELVSDGRSDFTTDVQPLDWQGCRLYDTPGINGWGRTRSRQDLEDAARQAVEIADVVLLCFDSQSQQASEFSKVADWVRAYRKPVIAVLNMRAPLWRHPARLPLVASRRKLSRTAQQHIENITDELMGIGLTGVPVVAIHSKRALFARATVPYRGALAAELESERRTHGLGYLDRWSNLQVLERLIAASISEGAAHMRLSMLREGYQARLIQWATSIDAQAGEQLKRVMAVEGVVADWLQVLGYPDQTLRERLPRVVAKGADLLDRLEDARGEPFTAPVSGRLDSHVRHLLSSHVYPLRTKALHAAEDLIIEAFASMKQVSEATFDREVFDQEALATAVARVADLAGDFVVDNLDLARLDAQIDLKEFERSVQGVRGDAGRGGRRAANVLKASSILSSSASAVLGVIALTNLWNPVGWTTALIFGALALTSGVLGGFGKWARKRAEKKRVEERSHAVAGARQAVRAFFDQVEAEQRNKIVSAAWENAVDPLKTLLQQALNDRRGCRALSTVADWLRAQAADLAPATVEPADVIRRASERVFAETKDWHPPTVEAVLRGEEWFFDPIHGGAAPPRLGADDREIMARAVDNARGQFASYLDRLAVSAEEPIRRWLADVSNSEGLDDAARSGIASAVALLDLPPQAVTIGDYSSGKTSLIKRLVADNAAAGIDGLHVDGRSATSDVRGYPYGGWTLVDVPGFQSGSSDHDEAAEEGARSAALLIVVLHVNLFIGDTKRLERLLLGDEFGGGKARNTIFTIGRIDEAGADPQLAPQDFVVRRKRKVDELRTILRSRGVTLEPGQVLALAADPYALVGDAVPVTASDYDDEARIWDGVDSLSSPLLGLGDEARRALAASAAADLARSVLRESVGRVEDTMGELGTDIAASIRLEQLAAAARGELRIIRQSIVVRTRSVVAHHANEVRAEALGAGPDEVEAMAERLRSWWEDPRLGQALEGLDGEIRDDLDDWARRNKSEFDRELRRLKIDAGDQQGRRKGREADGAVRVAAGGLKETARVVKALGNRDAVYGLVKAAGGKFKPWGAVKLSAKVAKVGAVLGVLALGFDIADWILTKRKEDQREAARRKADKHVSDTIDQVVESVLSLDDGAIVYVDQVDTGLTVEVQAFRDGIQAQQATLDAESRRREHIRALLAGAPTQSGRATEQEQS